MTTSRRTTSRTTVLISGLAIKILYNIISINNIVKRDTVFNKHYLVTQSQYYRILVENSTNPI
jgi:hypothetical protein